MQVFRDQKDYTSVLVMIFSCVLNSQGRAKRPVLSASFCEKSCMVNVLKRFTAIWASAMVFHFEVKLSDYLNSWLYLCQGSSRWCRLPQEMQSCHSTTLRVCPENRLHMMQFQGQPTHEAKYVIHIHDRLVGYVWLTNSPLGLLLMEPAPLLASSSGQAF